jgi:TonB family protein
MTQPGFTPFALVNSSTRYGAAQTISVTAHLAIAVALGALLATPQGPLSPGPTIVLGGHNPLLQYIPPGTVEAIEPTLGRDAGGGENELIAVRKGLLAPRSSMPLVPPRVPHRDEATLGAPPAVFDPNAPANVPLITNLGLPWMPKDTNSAGPGKGHGIGSGENGGMGDDSGAGAGMADGGDFANFVSLATCLYCPEPPYTEEARKAKVQGTITLRVLIGADGRAKRVQVLKGLGLGLDERATEAIRAWRFVPAKNARREPAASWVTIETRFQLL